MSVEPTVRLGGDTPQYPDDYPGGVLPAEEHTDRERYTAEVKQVLSKSWLVVAHEDEIAEPNSYLVWERMGESVVITRDDEGAVHAFHNVCRHRGMRIAEGKGCAANGYFTCRWHSWTYRMDGSIRSVPERPSFVGVDPLENTGPVVHCDTNGGFVWINLSPGSVEPLHEYMGEVATDLGNSKFPEFRLFRTTTLDVPVDWKLAVDSFIEAYHVRYLHKGTVGTSLLTPSVSYHILGRHSLLCQPFAKGYDAERYRQPVDHYENADNQFFVFPASTLDVVGGHAYSMSFLPLAADLTRIQIWQTYSTEKTSSIDRQEGYWEKFMEIAGEDVEVLTAVGDVRTSSAYGPMLLNQAECRIQHFHETVNTLLEDARR